MISDGIRLSTEQIRAIEAVLNGGDRAEIIPVKDGIKIFRQVRREIKFPCRGVSSAE